MALYTYQVSKPYPIISTSNSGVSLEFIEEFARMKGDIPSAQHCCTLSMDEMKMKSGLVFDYNGKLVGFVDLGGVNRDIELLLSGEDTSTKFADQTLVFMARAIFKPSLAMQLDLKGMICMQCLRSPYIHIVK